MVECEVWLVVNEDGVYSVGTTDEQAAENMDNEHGGYMRRMVKIVVNVPEPEPVQVTVDVPEETVEATAKVG